MKRFLALALCLIAALACESGVPYKVADHYFFRNDATIPENPIITTQDEFESLFGMAAVMGGLPTAIDFEKEFVLALVLPETDCPTTIHPKSLSAEGDTLTLTYKLDIKTKYTYTMQPCSILIVDRQFLKPTAVLKQL